jgi:hypothetical protein
MENQNSQNKPTGPAVAALLSAALGILALSITQVLCERSKQFTASVHALGKLWISGAEGIGPYSGKETIQLVVWVGAWALLHCVLRKKQIALGWPVIVFLVILGIATTFLWPPVTHRLASIF